MHLRDTTCIVIKAKVSFRVKLHLFHFGLLVLYLNITNPSVPEQEACEVINKRLEPYKEKNPKGTWEQWISAAYFDRVSLSATGFYKTPGLDFDWNTFSGNIFNYFSYGVAVSEVEIDTLTGDHQVLRTDIVMDVGKR